MEYKGASAYNNEQFFEDFIARRNREVSPNNLIERPIILEMMGDVKGKRILDLGCGDALFGIELLQSGCSVYEGVEGSENMAELASKNLMGTEGKVHLSSMECWDFTDKQFDMVVSRLVFHYLADLKQILSGVYRTLKDDGKFVFSVQHPVLLSSTKSATTSGTKTDWIVDDYFHTGKRVERWIDKAIVKYHRTVEEYFQLLKQVGFKIEDLREGVPKLEHFNSESEYQRRMRIPLFLMFSCEK